MIKLKGNIFNHKFKALILILFMILFGQSFLSFGQEDINKKKFELGKLKSGSPNPGKPTDVQVGMLVIDIDEISDSDQSFTVNFFYVLRWRDTRLAHDQGDVMIQPLDSIWNPRIQLTNQQKVWSTFPKTVSISRDGLVTYRQRVWGNFSQPLKLHDFPMDEQVFTITMAAAGYNHNDVSFIINDSLAYVTRTPSIADWKILSHKAFKDDLQIIPSRPGVASVSLSFVAKRYLGYYVFTIIIPLILIMLMASIIFWLPATDIGHRVSVSITSMLTVIAYRFMITNSLPVISYLTRLDKYILFSTVLIFSTLFYSILVKHKGDVKGVEFAAKIDGKAKVWYPIIIILATALTLILGVI
ncbi:ligand-gated ion channel [Sediminitomix flava]|uniref:Neurotransmitter-gated ion-channel n=1 Tax=Sediminitomix flava TaxID=379075 RepID=A0A315ZF09_SEDFL|nr:hypothetical protein [Sediminitomix flava]PWJ43912.1 neurotransmitter-gated ion-channel [Sediminitomix flava]